MKSIVFILSFFLLTLSVSAQALSSKPASVIINGSTVSLYYVSASDLGFMKNTIGTTYDEICSRALAQGYKLCSPTVIDKLYAVYTDGTKGDDWDGTKALTICSAYNCGTVMVNQIGKGPDGKYLHSNMRDNKTFCTFLSTKTPFLVFVK